MKDKDPVRLLVGAPGRRHRRGAVQWRYTESCTFQVLRTAFKRERLTEGWAGWCPAVIPAPGQQEMGGSQLEASPGVPAGVPSFQLCGEASRAKT
jgi:hypothetical protein